MVLEMFHIISQSIKSGTSIVPSEESLEIIISKGKKTPTIVDEDSDRVTNNRTINNKENNNSNNND